MENSKVLIIDDEQAICKALTRSLAHLPLDISSFLNPNDALQQIKTDDGYSIIIADYNLPGMNGLEFLDEARKLHPSATLVLISGVMNLKVAQEAINRHNVRHVLVKPWNKKELLDVVENSLSHYQQNIKYESLMNNVSSQLNDLSPSPEQSSLDSVIKENREAFLDGLIGVLGIRDTETKSHSRRVAAYATLLGKKMGLNGQQLEDLEIGSLLHDIGKMGVPDAILLKPGKLTDEEWENMRKHPSIGLDIINKISWLDGARKVVGQHHERFDGNGYPNGLKGDEIAIQARIFAVVDTLDAMTSDRPYRSRLPFSKALSVVTEEKSKQFDPEVVEAFLSIDRKTWEDIRIRYEDSREELEALGVKEPIKYKGFIDE